MSRLRFGTVLALCFLVSLLSRASVAQEVVPTDPPAASSRRDLTEFAKTNKIMTFVGLSEARRSATSLATLLSAALIRANQTEQSWLVLGPKGIIPRDEYGSNPSIEGFVVITPLVEIDANDKPVAISDDEVTHLGALDFFNKDSAVKMISEIVKGRPNGRFRVIGFWVNDVGVGQVQTTQRAGKEQWQALMNAGDKAPPLQLLKNTTFIDPHITALVYEYQVSAINGGAPVFVPQGHSVLRHLKASGLWSVLGLR